MYAVRVQDVNQKLMELQSESIIARLWLKKQPKWFKQKYFFENFSRKYQEIHILEAKIAWTGSTTLWMDSNQ